MLAHFYLMNQEASYHHGDLRRVLLEAARETIRTKGAANLTLRGVARKAKVSHAAPYHHFKDKQSLLAAVAEEGFRELLVSVSSRSAKVDSPSLALQEAAIAYVIFAFENAELFRVMFGPQLSDKSSYPSLQASGESAYHAIEEGIKRCISSGEETNVDVAHIALASWAAIHGLAVLLIDNQFGLTDLLEVENLARQVTDVFWVGIVNSTSM